MELEWALQLDEEMFHHIRLIRLPLREKNYKGDFHKYMVGILRSRIVHPGKIIRPFLGGRLLEIKTLPG